MKCGYDKEQLTRFLHGELSAEEQAGVETHLTECNECRREWEGLRAMWGMLEEVDTPEPSADAQVRFDAMLDSYKDSVRSGDRRTALWWRLRELFRGYPAFALGYSLLLVVAGLGFGYWFHRPAAVAAAGSDKQELAALTSQVGEMREMIMKTLLQNPSASERMRGVSYTSEIKTVNKDVVGALLSTLNNDPNINVRLMTLEALTHYANNPLVREGLVQSILQQDSPLLQTALAEVMLHLQEKRAIHPLKKLLQQKDLNEMVRTRIQETIFRLS
ncbi:zf-HC2 domain-containing protein [Puia sp.]|jgi:hypothetical protein|uniref:zf-HC2 domain-containing protein n=1 Tax=Puia sp. TaxID=2045100 RepID=UPI002F41D962